MERDRYRMMINKLREETGILFKPKLLEDMENAIQEADTTVNALKEMKEKQETQLSQLRAIRKNIEIVTNYKMLPTAEERMRTANAPSRIFKGRPELKKPISK